MYLFFAVDSPFFFYYFFLLIRRRIDTSCSFPPLYLSHHIHLVSAVRNAEAPLSPPFSSSYVVSFPLLGSPFDLPHLFLSHYPVSFANMCTISQSENFVPFVISSKRNGCRTWFAKRIYPVKGEANFDNSNERWWPSQREKHETEMWRKLEKNKQWVEKYIIHSITSRNYSKAYDSATIIK